MQIINPPGGGSGSAEAPLNLVQPASDFAWFLQPAANYNTAWTFGGGSFGKTKGMGFWTRNSNSNFTGNRQDNFWGLLYNFSPTSTGSVWADNSEVTFGIRWEDFWLQTIASGANISGTPSYSSGTDKTTVTASANIFHGTHIGALLYVNSTHYLITDVDSPTQIKVKGDASSRTGAIVVRGDYVEWHHIFGYIGQNSSGLNESGQRFVAGQCARQTPWMQWDYMFDRSVWQDSLGVTFLDIRPEWCNTLTSRNYTTPPFGKVASATYDGSSKTTVVFDRVMFESNMTTNHSLRVGDSGGVTGSVARYAITDYVDATSVKVSGDQTSVFTLNKRVAVVRKQGSFALKQMQIQLDNGQGGLKIANNAGTLAQAIEIDTNNDIYIGQHTLTNNVYMVGNLYPGHTATGMKFGDASSKWGWWGAAPVARSTGWAITNGSTRKTLDVSTATTAQVAEMLGTLVTTLLNGTGGYGLLAS